MGVKRFRAKAMDRAEWKKLCAMAKALQKLQCNGGGGAYIKYKWC
jgi:hypothetical protein